MNECPVQASAPVTAAVIGELQNKPGPPENSNARRQPADERIRRARDLPGKTPGHRREDEERKRNEPGMDAEHLPNQQRQPGQLLFPVQNSDEKQIEYRNGQLKPGGGLQPECQLKV